MASTGAWMMRIGAGLMQASPVLAIGADLAIHGVPPGRPRDPGIWTDLFMLTVVQMVLAIPNVTIYCASIARLRGHPDVLRMSLIWTAVMAAVAATGGPEAVAGVVAGTVAFVVWAWRRKPIVRAAGARVAYAAAVAVAVAGLLATLQAETPEARFIVAALSLGGALVVAGEVLWSPPPDATR